MTWLKIDDGFMRNQKIKPLSDRAFRLHMAGLCYCAANLTDGALDGQAVRIVVAEINLKRPAPVLGELIDAELWLPIGDGYLVKDFLEYNPQAVEVKELRKARSEAGRLGGIRSGASRRGEASASKQVLEQAVEASRLNPVPSRKDQKTLGELGLFRPPAGLDVAVKAASTGA